MPRKTLHIVGNNDLKPSKGEGGQYLKKAPKKIKGRRHSKPWLVWAMPEERGGGDGRTHSSHLKLYKFNTSKGPSRAVRGHYSLPIHNIRPIRYVTYLLEHTSVKKLSLDSTRTKTAYQYIIHGLDLTLHGLDLYDTEPMVWQNDI